jgi:hypothetical protein
MQPFLLPRSVAAEPHNDELWGMLQKIIFPYKSINVNQIE